MAARLDSVAKFICERGDWTVSNLQLQKIMYLAQMLYMGEHAGERLFDGTFEAWNYGPVEPVLYHVVKSFGSRSIEDVFYSARRFADDSTRKAFLDNACPQLLRYKPHELVAITHWDGGAWAKYYEPNTKNIRIPDSAIFEEYKARTETRSPS
jgi:uncharacterized phage-associated protein